MFFQEATQQIQVSDTSKIIIATLAMLLSNLFTYLLTRGKSKSEIDKNLADTHKSEAEATKSQIETIRLLHDELDEVLITAKALRKDVIALEDINDELKDAIVKADKDCQIKYLSLEQSYSERRDVLLALVKKVILELSFVIDELIGVEIGQVMRMKVVKILEALHNLKETLEKQ